MPKDFYILFHVFSTFHCFLNVKSLQKSLNSEQTSTKKLKKNFNDASGLLCIISLFSTVSRPFSSPPFCFSTNRIPRFCAKRARSILFEICDTQKSGENPIYLIAFFAPTSISRLVRHTFVLPGSRWRGVVWGWELTCLSRLSHDDGTFTKGKLPQIRY